MEDEIKIWEIENQKNIVGWEICYAYKKSKKEDWITYDGYCIIRFTMKDESIKEFKRVMRM